MNITSKYRSLSVQAKAALWFTICSFLQKGISFITVPIFTRLMSTEEYGTYTVYLSWLQILTIMTSLYLFNGVYDNAMAKYEKQRDEYTSAMQGLTLVITGAVFALYCFTSGFWEKILNLPKSMILLMFLEALLSPALSYWSGRQRFEYRYRILVCVTILQALMNPIASLVLIRMNGGTAMMRILGIVGVQICICVPIIVFQFCKGKEFFSKEYWGYALRIGIPIVPHYLSGIILNQGDRIMIDKMVGKTEVALYGLAYSIGMLVQLFIIFYGLPSVGIMLDAFPAAVIAFAFNEGAYCAETMRGALESVPQGQLEAGYCVGMSWWQIMRRIVLPQALRTAVPALSNSLIGMIKDTSLASNITVAELFMAGQRVAARTYIFLPIYCEVAVVYLLFCTVITKLQGLLERQLNAHGFQ